MRLIARLELLDDAVMIPVRVLRAWLAEDAAERQEAVEPGATLPSASIPALSGEQAPARESWRTLLWTCAPETRLGVSELSEALGRSSDWVYRACSAKWATARGREPLPCSKLDGALQFRAGSVRDWLRRAERVMVPTPEKLRALR